MRQRNFEESGSGRDPLSCLQEITESERTQKISSNEQEVLQESIKYNEFMKSRDGLQEDLKQESAEFQGSNSLFHRLTDINK